MNIIREIDHCRCMGVTYPLHVYDPDTFAVPEHSIDITDYFIARSIYAVPSFSNVLHPFFIDNSGLMICLPEQERFWLEFESDVEMIAYKLKNL